MWLRRWENPKARSVLRGTDHHAPDIEMTEDGMTYTWSRSGLTADPTLVSRFGQSPANCQMEVHGLQPRAHQCQQSL
jgi:hypothetical protein